MVERMRILRSHLRKVTATYTRTRRAAILRRAGAVAAAVSLLVTSPGIAPVAAQDAGRSALASVKPDALDAITQPAMGGGLTAASAAVVPPPGIVSWWTGDGTVTDLMDRNPGRFVGPVAYATGAVGAGFAFPGKDAALVVPDDGPDTGLGLTGDFTIDAWVFRTANQRGEQFLAGKAAAYSLSLDEGRAKATVVSDTLFSYDAVSSTVIPLNTWTHLAAVYDRAEGHLSIYVNGEVENLVNTGGAAVVINQNPFNIGGMLALGGSLKPARFYQGRMDEVDLYNRPLTVGEVRATVAAGAAGKDKRRPGLAGWWEAEGDAADFSGRHPGRLEGSAGYAPGKVGQAFSFGGRDGAVTVPATADNRLLGLTGSFTLDAWVYRSTNQSGIQWIAGKAKSYFLTLENAKVRAGFAVGPAMVSVLGATEIPAETWTHVAAVYDQRAGELQVFVNGVPDGAQNGLEGAPLAGDQPFTLGGLTAGGGSHLNGRIDEAGAYDRALTAEQIAAIAAAGSAGKIKPLTGLLNWWTADNFGRELLDGLPGRSVGGVLYTGGVSGAAFRFNGKDSAVVTPSAAGGSNLDVTADFTLDAWVFRSSDQAGRQWVAGRHQSYWLSLADGKVVGGFFHGDKDKQAIFLTSEKAIPVGVWTHLTLTYDRAAGLLRLYVNATSAGEAATDHVAVALSAFPFGIGAIVTTEDGAKPGQLLDGRVDEVDIYGRALSPAEVAASYVAEQSDKRRISAAPGAVRWWRGEGEVSDAQVGQPASAVGDVSFSEGKVGRAMYFNGVGSTVAVAADEKNSPYDIDSDFTLEGWVLRTVEQTGLRLIAGKQNTYHLSLMNGKLRTGFGYGAPPVYDLVGNTVIPVGVWTHIAATYDRTAGQLSVYVNGFLDASRSTTGGAAVNVTKTPFNIGGFYSPTNQFRPGSYFQGAVDELALYRRTLSAGELYGIWAAGERGKVEAPAGPVGLSWWPGDGNATDIMDRNLGALAGGAAFTTGKVGRAFRFNGTDAAVVVPDRGAISGLSLDSSFSVEGWVMPSTQQSGRQWVAGKAGSYGILLEDGAPRTGWSWDTPNEFAVAATTPIPVGVWTHLAAVHDRTAGELRLYVNGVLVGQAATGGASVNVNTLPFQIGGLVTPQGDLPPGQFFEGRVNELNLFDRPLSADEVNAIVAADRVGRRKPGYRAVVTAPGVPSTWQMGETKTFNVIVENSGTLPWNAAGANPVALNAFFLQSRVSLKPGDNWSQTQKIPLTADLPPGGRVTLKVSLTAPVAVCCQRVGFQVVKEGVTFMRGRTDVPITLKSAGTAIDATDAPAIWVLGRPRTFNISVTNAGKDAWAAAGAKRVIVRARFGSGAADVLLALPEGGVPAGQSRTFSVLLTPDALPGDDELTLEMVDHLGAPLPDTATRKAVTIYAAGFQAVITANTVPTRWLRGQEQTVTVTVRNAGGDVWTISGTNPMQLQAFFLNGTTTQAVGDNWTGTQTSTLPGDISPGESATLTFKMTAPTGYCCTKLGFQMVRKGIEAIPDRMEQTIILE